MAEKQHAPSVMKRYISPAVQEQVCAGTFRLCPSSLVPVKLLILCMVLPFVTSVKSSRSFVLNRSTTSAANKAPVVSVLQKPKPRARDTSYDKTSTLLSKTEMVKEDLCVEGIWEEEEDDDDNDDDEEEDNEAGRRQEEKAVEIRRRQKVAGGQAGLGA